MSNLQKNRVLTIIFCIASPYTNVLSPIRMIEAKLCRQLPDVSEVKEIKYKLNIKYNHLQRYVHIFHTTSLQQLATLSRKNKILIEWKIYYIHLPIKTQTDPRVNKPHTSPHPNSNSRYLIQK